MSKWFSDTFLTSIFEQTGVNKSRWLTQKQTAICINNMEKHTVQHAQLQGDYTNHNYFTCIWNNRKVYLSYSKLNGCGMIEFYMNDEEAQEANKKIEEEKKIIEQERIQRIKKNPERLSKKIETAKENVKRYEVELEYFYNELKNPIDGISKEETLEDIDRIKKMLENAKEELKKYID